MPDLSEIFPNAGLANCGPHLAVDILLNSQRYRLALGDVAPLEFGGMAAIAEISMYPNGITKM